MQNSHSNEIIEAQLRPNRKSKGFTLVDDALKSPVKTSTLPLPTAESSTCRAAQTANTTHRKRQPNKKNLTMAKMAGKKKNGSTAETIGRLAETIGAPVRHGHDIIFILRWSNTGRRLQPLSSVFLSVEEACWRVVEEPRRVGSRDVCTGGGEIRGLFLRFCRCEFDYEWIFWFPDDNSTRR